MEHLCQRCGTSVEDCAPFCPHCDAPQVRFSGEEVAPQQVKVASQITPTNVLNLPVGLAPAVGVPMRLKGKHAFRAAMTSGLIAALLSLLPFVLFLAAPLGGFLSVLFYRRRALSGEPPTGAGFRLGALSGICAFVIFTVLVAGEVVLTHKETELRMGMIEAVQRQQARAPDAQTREMFDYFLTPRGLAIMTIGVLAMAAIVFVLLSGLGGTLAAVLLRRNNPEDS